MVKGILSFVSPRCLCDRTISLTDETAKKYTENGSELSEHFTPTCILKANGRRKRLSARAGNYTA